MSANNLSETARLAVEATQKSVTMAEETLRQARETLAQLQNAMQALECPGAQARAQERRRGRPPTPAATLVPLLPPVLGEPVDRAIRTPEMISIFGISSPSIYRRISRGLIPRPCRLGHTIVIWWRSEIEEIVEMMRDGADEATIQARVAQMNTARDAKPPGRFRGVRVVPGGRSSGAGG